MAENYEKHIKELINELTIVQDAKVGELENQREALREMVYSFRPDLNGRDENIDRLINTFFNQIMEEKISYLTDRKLFISSMEEMCRKKFESCSYTFEDLHDLISKVGVDETGHVKLSDGTILHIYSSKAQFNCIGADGLPWLCIVFNNYSEDDVFVKAYTTVNGMTDYNEALWMASGKGVIDDRLGDLFKLCQMLEDRIKEEGK